MNKEAPSDCPQGGEKETDAGDGAKKNGNPVSGWR